MLVRVYRFGGLFLHEKEINYWQVKAENGQIEINKIRIKYWLSELNPIDDFILLTYIYAWGMKFPTDKDYSNYQSMLEKELKMKVELRELESQI